jgi:glycosyltransferase involved in cell wall biosynthesis
MTNDYMCTVLLVSYNSCTTISKAIESILEQKTKYKYKIHIFDDASTDGTKNIILDYAEKYPEIVFPYISEKNQGAQANYWRAFLSVDTPYCSLLDGDDFFCNPHKLELQIDALEKHPKCSFCGHDTYLFSEQESFREYEEGSRALTAPILKTKSIFTYQDFVPIKTGGYICYDSARVIRSSAMKLDSIKYKEAFLFDFSQFYYLLLQGDYYYIDIPMSAYVRNGAGVCSGKSPVAFLNDFMQAAIEFNKQTNNVIADKIYSDCLLQIQFRLELFEKSAFPVISSAAYNRAKSLAEVRQDYIDDDQLLILNQKLSQDKFYYLCNGGFGHTMFICAYKSAIEKIINGQIVLLVRPEHKFIPELYKILDFLCVDMTDLQMEFLSSQCPNPEKGKIYVTHPFSHIEALNYYVPVQMQYSTVRYLPWLLKFYDLPEGSKFALYDSSQTVLDQLDNKIKKFGELNKLILFFPESITLQGIIKRYWEKQAKELKTKGYTILSCVKNKSNSISGTHYIDLTAEESVFLGLQCHSVYCMRNGIADLLVAKGENLHVFYPSHATWYIYSLNSMHNRSDIDEKIVLEVEKYNKIQNSTLPKKAYLLGFIPVPKWCYRFYSKHRKGLKNFKRLVRWH